MILEPPIISWTESHIDQSIYPDLEVIHWELHLRGTKSDTWKSICPWLEAKLGNLFL
jgi:hypothetical protein